MSEFRREVLHNVTPAADTNAGLWLDKYLKDDDVDAKRNLVYEVAQIIKTPEAYISFYANWEKTLQAYDAVTKEAKTLSRLAVNLGSEATLENSIALNRTYGVPYIPGSALKGLASHYAINSLDPKEWGKGTQAYKNVFGDPSIAGYVNFFDALYVPSSGQPLMPDVVTIHHQEYYQNGNTPPADWDSPIPIPFLTANGSFLIAISGPADWVNAAYKILGFALEREGIGAKTSSGYGRMKFEGAETPGESITKKKSSVQQEIPAGYQRGVVKKFLDDYGFIQPDAGGKDIFVHFNDLAAGIRELRPGQHVIYKTGPGKKQGHMQAFDVRLSE